MPQGYTSKKFWELYKKLPKELKETIASDETADNIYDVCERHNIFGAISAVVEYTGQVLLGVLAPTDFQEALEKEGGIAKEIAKKVSQEIYRFIFYPVKPSLEELYRIEIAPIAKMPITLTPQEKPPILPKKDDVYREPIEQEPEL